MIRMSAGGMSLVALLALAAMPLRAEGRSAHTAGSVTMAKQGDKAAQRVEIGDWKKDWDHTTPAGMYARRKGEYISIGNRWLERVLRISDGTVRTVSLVNKVSGREPGTQSGADFLLQLSGGIHGELSAMDFAVSDIGLWQSPEGSLDLRFALKGRQHPDLTVDADVEGYPDRKYQRKWLTIRWSGAGDVVVDRVDVEAIPFGWWYVGNPTHFGYGQPLLVGDLYLGLEYPGAETTANYLRHFPGRSARGGLRTKTAVWGVAASPDAVRRAFLDDYLDTVIARPPHPFVIYNLLGTGLPEEKLLIHWIETISREAKRAGMHIDSFAVDDLWQDDASIWQPDPRVLPHGFAPITDALRANDTRLGLWLSLFGHTLNTRWGQQQGLEVTQVGERATGGRYCIAGPKYQARLKEVLRDYLVKSGVNYFKFDYNSFGCDDATHGHPVGAAGKDASIDAYIDVLKTVKSISPDTEIAITSGMWLSPWWRLYADFVWLGGSDGGSVEQVKSLTPADDFMNYRDTIMYEDYAVKGYVFPFSGLMTHGFWTSGASFSKFKDDAMLTIGRGITKWEILTSPQELDAKRYAFLGQAMRWGKANWDILRHTEMILGDPGKGEVYGYAHAGEGAALLVLRNPGLASKVVDVPLSAIGAAGQKAIADGKEADILEVYPTLSEMDEPGNGAANLHVEVLGAQCKVVAVVWDPSLVERVKLER